MMKKPVILLVVFLGVGLLVFACAYGTAKASPQIFADSKSAVCEGATMVAGGDCDNTTGNSVANLVQSIITFFAWVLGILSVIYIMYGGFKYVTAGGDSGKVTSARNAILFALIGLVIAALAQTVVKYVIGLFT